MIQTAFHNIICWEPIDYVLTYRVDRGWNQRLQAMKCNWLNSPPAKIYPKTSQKINLFSGHWSCLKVSAWKLVFNESLTKGPGQDILKIVLPFWQQSSVIRSTFSTTRVNLQISSCCFSRTKFHLGLRHYIEALFGNVSPLVRWIHRWP